MRREVVRKLPDGTAQVRWRNPVNGRFVAAPDGPAVPKAAAKAVRLSAHRSCAGQSSISPRPIAGRSKVAASCSVVIS